MNPAMRSEKKSDIFGMNMVFLFLVLIGGLWGTDAGSVTGQQGGHVEIHCSHSNAATNVKYLCRDPCGYEDVLIRSVEKTVGRYSINDKGNTFYVTISHLTPDDAGVYWCGVERVGVDTFNRVGLTVIRVGNGEDDGGTFMSNSGTLVYIGAGLGVVLLALAVVLLMFLKHQRRDIRSSSAKCQTAVHAPVSSMEQNASEGATAAPLVEPSDGTTSSCLYAVPSKRVQRDDGEETDNTLVSSEPQNQSDGLFYSTIDFNFSKDRSSVTPQPAAVLYSTLTPPDESAVYCDL